MQDITRDVRGSWALEGNFLNRQVWRLEPGPEQEELVELGRERVFSEQAGLEQSCRMQGNLEDADSPHQGLSREAPLLN